MNLYVYFQEKGGDILYLKYTFFNIDDSNNYLVPNLQMFGLVIITVLLYQILLIYIPKRSYKSCLNSILVSKYLFNPNLTNVFNSPDSFLTKTK